MSEKILIKKLVSEIQKKISKLNELISISFVGSIENKSKFQEISDIDVVVIINNLNKTSYNRINKRIKNIDLLKLGIKNKKLKINNKFGPLKYNTNKNIVIHLMIYDLENHYSHVYNSPFTCYDWERSKKYFGKKLSNIYPVRKIQPKDFFSSRRGILDYINDLDKGSLSYREYIFSKNNFLEIKKNFKINKKSTNEFSFHILKFLLINTYKLEKQKNILISDKALIEKIREYSDPEDVNSNLKKFKKIKKIKYNSKDSYPDWTFVWIKKFLKSFNSKFKFKWDTAKTIYFIRHFKTNENKIDTFLGCGRDPSLNNSINININKNFLKIKPDFVYSSYLKRAYQTARLIFNKKKIIKSKLINEIDYGLAEGLNFTQLSNFYPKLINDWNKKKDAKFPNGENTKSVKKRLNNFIKILVNNNFKSSAIITHNVVMRCLIGELFNLPLNDYNKINISHGQVIEVKVLNGKLYPNINRKDLSKIFYKIDKKL